MNRKQPRYAIQTMQVGRANGISQGVIVRFPAGVYLGIMVSRCVVVISEIPLFFIMTT